MKNKYFIVLPLLLFISTAVLFLNSESPISDKECNCSGPKAFKASDEFD